MDEFRPLAVSMASDGNSKEDIVSAFQAQLKIKTQQYYRRTNLGFSTAKDLFTSKMKDIENSDSKAEMIFYDMLIARGLKFEFQYSIGPYKADYLFAGFLVFELDGPQHNKAHDEKRDSYLRRMGYKVIRVPIWILVSCPEAVIDEIQAAITERK